MQKQKAAKLIGIGFTVILMMGGCSGNAAAPSRESISEEIVVEKAENGNYIEGESEEKSAEKSREEEETGKLYGEKSAEGAEAGKLSGEKNDGDVPENENKAVSNSTDGKYSRLYEMYDYDESEWTGYSPTLLLDYNIPEDYVQFTCEFWAQNAYFSTKAQPQDGDYFIQTFTFATEENIPDLDKIYLEYSEDEIRIYSYVKEYSEAVHDYVEVRWPEPAKFKCTWDSRFDN